MRAFGSAKGYAAPPAFTGKVPSAFELPFMPNSHRFARHAVVIGHLTR
jgi:hypothetical protein